MKKNAILICAMLVAASLIWVGYSQFYNHRDSHSAPTLEAIEQANKLMGLADQYSRERQYEKAAEAHNTALSIGGEDVVRNYLRDKHDRRISAIDSSWDSIDKGNELWKMARYTEAAEFYKKAYDAGGENAVSGMHLAESYEKLGRYDDGVAILDEMIAKGYLSANGVKEANTFKDRLIAAKTEN